MKLYRPVGLKEYIKIKNVNFKAFPPRFDYQPIFYPVLNVDYASQIAEDWNTKDKTSDYVGIVLEFEVNDKYIAQFQTRVVGNASHAELWIPAERLDEFNHNIIGTIGIVKIYYGAKYSEDKIDVK